MSITYSITEAEFKEYVKLAYKNAFTWKKSWIYIIIIVLVLIGFNAYNWSSNDSTTADVPPIDGQSTTPLLGSLLSWLLWIVVLGVLWIFIFRRLGGSVMLKKEDRDLILGERTMTFDTDKVQVKALTAETTYQWNALKKWDQTTNLYLLYISSNAAIIVPKRAFATALEEQAFETLLNTKIQNLTSEKYLDA